MNHDTLEWYGNRIVDLEAQLAEASKSAARWNWWMTKEPRDTSGLMAGIRAGWEKEEWERFVDIKIAELRKETK